MFIDEKKQKNIFYLAEKFYLCSRNSLKSK